MAASVCNKVLTIPAATCVSDSTVSQPADWVENSQPQSVTITDWTTVKSQIDNCGLCDNGTGFPEWDGTLTVRYAPDFVTEWWLPAGSTADTGDGPQFNLNGSASALNFGISLSFIATAYWTLEFYCQSGVGTTLLWSGTRKGLTPDGTFLRNTDGPPGCAVGPDCMHVTGNYCTADSGAAVPEEIFSWPSSIRIVDYLNLVNQFGVCATCAAPIAEPAFDGNFPVTYSTSSFNLEYFAATANPAINEFPPLKIGSARLNNTAQVPLNTTYISVKFLSLQYWQLVISCRNLADAANIVMWEGQKDVGTTAVGTYMRRATTQSAIGPPCIVLESY